MKTIRNFLKIWILLTSVLLFVDMTPVNAENIFSQIQIYPSLPSQTKEKSPSFLGEHNFSPEEESANFITREDVAHTLYQFYNANPFLSFLRKDPTSSKDSIKKLISYEDEHAISPSAQESVLWAYQENFMVGYPDGQFHPQNSITSQELFCILEKMLGYDGAWENPSLNSIGESFSVSSQPISRKNARVLFDKFMDLQPKKSVFSMKNHIENKGAFIKKDGVFSEKRWPSWIESIEVFMPAIKGQPVYALKVNFKKTISKKEFLALKEKSWGIRGPLDDSFLPISSYLHDFHDNILIFHLPAFLGPHCIEMKDELFLTGPKQLIP